MNQSCDPPISDNITNNINNSNPFVVSSTVLMTMITRVSTMMIQHLDDVILKDPETLFRYLMGTLVVTGITAKIWPYLIQSKYINMNMHMNMNNISKTTNNNNIATNNKEDKGNTATAVVTTTKSNNHTKPPEIQALQRRFLPVFFLFRMSFWMSGPYFFQLYSSKVPSDDPVAAKEFVCRVSLVGYLTIVLLGPMTGRFTEQYGRKTATICAGVLYGIGSLSVFATTPILLYLGRAIGSIASSWLCSAPESWLIGEYFTIQQKRLQKQKSCKKKKKKKDDDNGDDDDDDDDDDYDDDDTDKFCWLSETFRLAYAGDAIVAIIAGQSASFAANYVGGPTGPFSLSPAFIITALVLVVSLWAGSSSGSVCGSFKNKVGESDGNNDNTTKDDDDHNDDDDDDDDNSKEKNNGDSTRTGLKMIFSDRKILLLGLVQSLFEGSMYIFVVVWPPAMSNNVRICFGPDAVTPFGTVFSCFMACAFLGSIICGKLGAEFSIDVRSTMTGILCISTLSFMGAVYGIHSRSLFGIIAAFFAFETCVGMYFPSIAKLRSTVIPESHRPTIMTLFTVPLNVLVVGVIAFHPIIGDLGSLGIASIAMGIATSCMIPLRSILQEEDHQQKLKARQNWARVRGVSGMLFALSRTRSREKLKALEKEKQHFMIGTDIINPRARASMDTNARLQRSVSIRGF